MSIRPGLDLPHLRHQHHHPPQGHHAVKYNSAAREFKLSVYGLLQRCTRMQRLAVTMSVTCDTSGECQQSALISNQFSRAHVIWCEGDKVVIWFVTEVRLQTGFIKLSWNCVPSPATLLNQKYHASANSSPDPFLNQSAFRKLANNQSQVLKKDQASLSATL